MTEFAVEVWLEFNEKEAVTITVEADPPLTPMKVKDTACNSGVFNWIDYDRIRFKRVKK